MGINFSSPRTKKFLIGDLCKLSIAEVKLFQLSHYVLDKDNEFVGEDIDGLNIKILDTYVDMLGKNKLLEINDDQSHSCSAGKGDQSYSQSIHGDKEVSEFTWSNFCDVKCLFYILVTDKPFYFSQSFSQWRDFNLYINIFPPPCCRQKQHTIYIQPVDSFPDFITDFDIKIQATNYGFFELLQCFAEAFFDGMNIKLLPSFNIETSNWSITTRIHSKTGQRQYLVKDFFKALQRIKPRDGHSIIGVSWTDLYPSEELNFVLGEANFFTQSGIFCFGRYEPKNFDCSKHKDILQIDGKVLWRILKVFSHETCHLFGLQHCWYFHCAMNDSNSIALAASQPLFLCPVCLRKLQYACGFDVLSRYKKLLTFFANVSLVYPNNEFKFCVKWLHKCIEFLETVDLDYQKCKDFA